MRLMESLLILRYVEFNTKRFIFYPEAAVVIRVDEDTIFPETKIDAECQAHIEEEYSENHFAFEVVVQEVQLKTPIVDVEKQ